MKIRRSSAFSLCLLMCAACGAADQATGNSAGELSAKHDAAAQGGSMGGDDEFPDEGADVAPPADGGAPSEVPPELPCPKGGDTGVIRVTFGCEGLTIVSCKDLSNVVLELADGSHERFEGLTGHTGIFAPEGGGTVVGVWVKAGANHSGDGPGYGERFDAPEGACTPLPPAAEPPADEPGDGVPSEPPGDQGVPTEPASGPVS